MSSTLARIEIRLSQELKDQVSALAAARGVSVSEIGLAALQGMLEQDGSHETEIHEALERLEAMLKTFVRMFLTVTLELPEEARQAAAIRGHARWASFQALLHREREDG